MIVMYNQDNISLFLLGHNTTGVWVSGGYDCCMIACSTRKLHFICPSFITWIWENFSLIFSTTTLSGHLFL